MSDKLFELIDDLALAENFSEHETARSALRAEIDEVVRERDDLASRVRELARIISDDGTPDEDLYQSLTEGLPEVVK
jgi:uncharacterized coiled-coil DUF342 family protein